MEQLRESNIVTTRFWDHVLTIAPHSKPAEVSYRHALFILFLHSDYAREEMSRFIASHVLPDALPPAVASSSNPALEWLMTSPPSQYAKRLQAIYFTTLDLWGRNHREGLGFASDSDWLFDQGQLIQEWHAKANLQQVLQTFDSGQIALRQPAIDQGRTDFAANLAAACMINDECSIGDFFDSTGQFAKIVAGQSGKGVKCVLGRRDSYDEIIEMWLYMQRIEFEYVEHLGLNDGGYAYWPFEVKMLLLDPTPKNGGRNASKAPEGNKGNPYSAIELIGELCSAHSLFKLALVVVPHADCTSLKWPASIRRRLVEQRRIVAVIDAPRKSTEGTRFSVWLVRGDEVTAPPPRDDILFIAASQLSLLNTGGENGPITKFIAALIADVHEDFDAQIALLHRLEDEHPLLARILAREFAPGHHEAAGLSQSVQFEDIENNNFNLTAQAYLVAPAKSSWFKGLDMGALDELLVQSVSNGRRMYIIGNNGEGKSMLLRDVAAASASAGRETIAIAFGASDRFPKKMTGKAGQCYSYRGARRGGVGISAIQAAVEAGRLMLDIYSAPSRLSVFERIADLIGFASQQFLIPKGIAQNTGGQDGLIGGIIRLASNDPDDKLMKSVLRQSPERLKECKLGLRRRTEQDGIVPFDELSSGEQQILLLAVKMIAESKPGILFVVDEPEISLHVGWQRTLPIIFEHIASAFKVDILVATHSPVVIASADDEGDFCFTIRDRQIQTLSLADRRSVETALFEGFRTYTNNNREVHERCASLVADFIDCSNAAQVGDDPEAEFIAKLNQMKDMINEQKELHDQEAIAFDISLIERAKSAVREIALVDSLNAANGGEN